MIARLLVAAVAVLTLAGWGGPQLTQYDPRYVIPLQPVWMLIGPGVHYAPLATVPANTRLPIVTCEYRTGWCLVRYGRYDGWVHDPYRQYTHHEHWWFLGH